MSTSKNIFHRVRYKLTMDTKEYRKGYISPIWSKTLIIPVILSYELYRADKKTLVKVFTIQEAENYLSQNLICRG